jgi:hypothetical protein
VGAIVDAIGKETAQPRKQLMDRFDDQPGAIAILDIGGVDFGTQQTAGIGYNMALTPLDLLGGIPRVAATPRPRTGSATRPAALGRLNRLTVDHPGRRACFATGRLARLPQQLKIDLLKQAVVLPIVEIACTVVNGGKSFGSIRY